MKIFHTTQTIPVYSTEKRSSRPARFVWHSKSADSKSTRACLLDKVRPLYLVKMGASCSKVSTTPDPKTGLSERDIKNIRAVWHPMVQNYNSKKTGPQFFIRLFLKYPYLTDYFPESYKPNENGQAQSLLRAHATAVITGISSYVDCADEPDVLVPLIHRHTLKHYQMGVKVTDMEKAREVLFDLTLEKSKFSKSSEQIKSWEKFLDLHGVVAGARMEELIADPSIKLNENAPIVKRRKEFKQSPPIEA